MSRSGSQLRTLSGLLGHLRPHWRRDSGLPSRIEALLRGDRRLGSRDRRLYRELIYTALRYLPWVEPLLDGAPEEALRRIAWLAADTAATRAFREEVARGLPACPPGVDERASLLGADPAALSPGWLASECPEALRRPLRDVLLGRAPLWVRVQREEEAVREEFGRLGWSVRPSPWVVGAFELPVDADVARSEAYRLGRVEVQDAGSQRVLASLGIEPGGHWLNACAGAGGKTLQLASLLGGSGRVSARDLRPAALEELRVRAERAGLGERIEIGSQVDPQGGFDGILVDAPCSGSGTWRRAPHLRWTTTPGSIARAASLQASLLREAAQRVRRGGRLVYATCSLCESENEAVRSAFLAAEGSLEPDGPGARLMPDQHDGDGFYVASFRKP